MSTDTFSVENGDGGEEDSVLSEVSSRPSLSDIFERSEEGETESRVKPSEIGSSPESPPSEQQRVPAEPTKHDGPSKLKDCTHGSGLEKGGEEGASPGIEHSGQLGQHGAQIPRDHAAARSDDSDLDGKGSKPDGKSSSHNEENLHNLPDGTGLRHDEEAFDVDGKGSSQDGKSSTGDVRPKPVLRDPALGKHNPAREVSFDENIQLAVVEEGTTSDPAIIAGQSTNQEAAHSHVDAAHAPPGYSSMADALATNKRTGQNAGSGELSGRGSRASSAPTFTNQAVSIHTTCGRTTCIYLIVV